MEGQWENPKRATTSEQKREVIEDIFHRWVASPHLRLGQLLINLHPGIDLFHVEDFDLIPPQG
jgi:hypothetical protein